MVKHSQEVEMIIPDFASRLAHLLATHTVPVQKGDFVVIQSTTEALPMIEALAKAVLECGGVPHPVINLPGWDEYFHLHGSRSHSREGERAVQY
jgi:leucyl aminopeptidase (aminopeptidase T)